MILKEFGEISQSKIDDLSTLCCFYYFYTFYCHPSRHILRHSLQEIRKRKKNTFRLARPNRHENKNVQNIAVFLTLTFRSGIYIYTETIFYQTVTCIIRHGVVRSLLRASLHYSDTATRHIQIISSIIGYYIIGTF